MGIQAGSGRTFNETRKKARGRRLTPLLLVMTAAFLSTSCATSPSSARRYETQEWSRATPRTPQLLARSFYGPQEVTATLVEELEDVARPARSMTRMGNGMISIRLQDERGRRLPAVECGGHLIVLGAAGQACQLVVKNETDVPVEILPSMDGLDLETGAPTDLERRGRIVPPRDKTVFATISGGDGKAEPLRFREVADTGALYRTSPGGTLGSIAVAVFLPKGANSFESRPSLERRKPALPGTPGALPQRRYEPMLLPYQYR